MSNGFNITTPIGDIGIGQQEQKQEEESTAEKIGWLVLGALVTSIVGYVGVKAIQSITEDKSKTEEYI